MKPLAIFTLLFVLYSPQASGFGRSKEGKCPPVTGKENCAARLLDSEFESNPCSTLGQDFECLGDDKCCDDGCGGYECKPAIGLPPLPVIEPNCGAGDQCEPANITYCYANQCNKCCIHNSVCKPSSDHITKDECEKKLCKDILCPGQGEICRLDKYHRAVCECPTECPTVSSLVCGSDGVTYDNECEMNMSACVTGDRISVVSQGECLPPTQPNPLEICKLPKDNGYGWTLELKYYFNKAKGVCEGFIYYGKGGNENNFLRYKDCKDHCSEAISDVCVLPKVVGPCRAAFPRWYFNSIVQSCERFTYGGCSGNRNNFETEAACNAKCVCGLPKAPGVCLGYFPSWYYDATTGQCEEFVYGGCRGNNNRFYNKERCLKTCGATNVNPVVTAQCQDKNKFKCRSIKKCLPVKLKCNGVDDCGDNSDEEGCDPCANTKCLFYSTCVKTKNNTALCDCPVICTADWKPVCGSDNETYPNLCTMQVQSCKNQQMIAKVRDGECSARAKSKCENQRDEELAKLLVGTFIPQCEDDGRYSNTQCHGSTGYCWCVDIEGTKLEETEVKYERPNCTEQPFEPCRGFNCDYYATCVSPEVGVILCECPTVCAEIYSPVCGSDGKTYSNLCEMQVTSCRNQQLITKQSDGECATGAPTTINICDMTRCEFGKCVQVDGNTTCQCDSACPLNYQPVCGSDNQTYPNLCVLEATACERKESIKEKYSGECKLSEPIDPCENVTCNFYATCTKFEVGALFCQCPTVCTREFNPVCGSDGQTYSNLCEMKVTSCRKQELITKQNDGECATGAPTTINICDMTRCEFGKCVQVDGNTTCQCDSACPRNYQPVCGSDNQTYPNLCILEATACERKENIKEQYSGECKTSEPIDPCQNVTCNYYATCVSPEVGALRCECPEVCPDIFNPVCGSDGQTYSNLCEMKVTSCEKQELITKQNDGECLFPLIGGAKPKSKCEKERDAFDGRLLIGAFVPQCEEDGSYKAVQCHGSTGYCWCVDIEGTKLAETEIRSKRPNCTTDLPPTIPPTDPCELSLCEFGRCVTVNGSATCECDKACPLIDEPVCGSDNKTYSNLCVMDFEACERKEHVAVKRKGPCGTKSKCETKLEGALLNKRPGSMTPSCESDGSYSPKQCHSSTGYCWCVTREGKLLPGTRLRFAQPDCSKVDQPDPCQNVKCDFYASCLALENGQHICYCPRFCTKEYEPVCGSNGVTYANLCEMKVASCLKQKMLVVTSPGQCAPITEPPIDPCQMSQCDFGFCVTVNGSATCECTKECPLIEQPVCGSDNKTYANLCIMDSEACDRKEHVSVQHNGPCDSAPVAGISSCAATKCDFYSDCQMVDGEAKCVCDVGCTRELDLKCGSDNMTYSNPCELRRASCEQMKEINIVSDGECAAPTSAPTVPATTALPKCENCPYFGKQNIWKSLCSNKFVIIGEIVNVSKFGRELSVKVEQRFKPSPKIRRTKFQLKSTVQILVQKLPGCRCDNVDFKKNEKYVLMGRKSRSKIFVIKYKTGFVEKVSKTLVDKLRKRYKTRCPRKFG